MKTLKKENLIKGKWYKWFWKINEKTTYGKVSIMSSDSFNVSEGIQNNIYSKVNGYFFEACTNIELLTDLSEIQQYLPNDHPDKISPIPEYVECIASVNGNQDPKVGKIIKAAGDGHLPGICLYNSITYKTCFRPSTKEAYEAQNKPKSLVGRYLKYIGSSIQSPKYGDYFKILSDNPGASVLRIEDNVKCIWNGCDHASFKISWELMPEDFILPQENKQEIKFEAGKWYRINGFKDTKWYARFLHYHEDTKQFLFSEDISIYGNYNNRNGYILLNNKVIIESMKDLSEIQQYLPDGHVDKIVQPKTYDFEVVHCKTKEQFNLVCEKLEYKNIDWNDYRDETCINLKARLYSSLSWYNKHNSLVYSFDGWLSKYFPSKTKNNLKDLDIFGDSVTQFKVGDKVNIPISRYGWAWSLNKEIYKLDYLIVTFISSDRQQFMVKKDNDNETEYSFHISDLTLYKEPNSKHKTILELQQTPVLIDHYKRYNSNNVYLETNSNEMVTTYYPTSNVIDYFVEQLKEDSITIVKDIKVNKIEIRNKSKKQVKQTIKLY